MEKIGYKLAISARKKVNAEMIDIL